MSGMERFNEVINYIEAHLAEDIDYRQVAYKACCSANHFQRMFSFLTDISLSEYIRRRRLTLAAFDLCESNAKIIDVATKYGYKSPEAFSRAFKSLHGIMPVAVRNSDVVLKAFPKLYFHMSKAGSYELDYRIVHEQAYTVCGITTDIPLSPTQTNTYITQFWEENIHSGVIGQFHRDIKLSYDISLNAALFNFRENKLSYMICYKTPLSGTPSGYASLTVPSLTWAVFSTPIHDSQETTAMVRSIRERIFGEWFPTSSYMHAGGPEFEIFKKSETRVIIEVWVPVIRKMKYE